MTRCWHALWVASALSLPTAASACGQISQNIWMCARDTGWETATWEQHGDSATVRMYDMNLTFDTQFPGSERGDAATSLDTLHGYFTEFVAENYDDDALMPRVIRTQFVDGENVAATQVMQYGTSLWDGHEYLETEMLAQVGGHRILLSLKGPKDMDHKRMQTEADNMLSFLRDTCADPVSCAEDYEWPPEAPLKED